MRSGASVEIAWTRVPPGSPRHEYARRLLAGLLPAPAEVANRCPRCGGAHGPLVVTGSDHVASVTYAGDLAIAAVAARRDAAALGIDAEPVDDPRRDAVGMTGLLGAGEATVRDWTRVEAALKADGRGLRIDPAAVAVAVCDDAWSATLPDGETYLGWDAAGPDGVVLSVAILSPAIAT